jgi:hypothetical protein
MHIFAFTGTLTNVNADMNWFMPDLAVGAFFSGTMTLTQNQSAPNITDAVLHIMSSSQLINARSTGLDPLKSFADHTPTGPLSSPTVQHGYVDSVFFAMTITPGSLGTAGFTVQGKGSDGTSKAGAASGTIRSIVAVI